MPPGNNLTPNQQRDAIAAEIAKTGANTRNSALAVMSSDITDDEAEIAYENLGLVGVEQTKAERRGRLFNIIAHPNPTEGEKQQVCREMLNYVGDVKVRVIYIQLFHEQP